ncbi:MAG: AI-2E family transporter [Anaerolineae bacterium]|nr:AI-2E family transporter [Anaerolineae bacterium]MDW8099865.1 AI-2E family transporter [Anaerolineae bacterium]
MSPRWSPLTKQIVTISGLVGLIWLISRFSQILGPLMMAIILAYFLNIPVRWLVRRTGWPRTGVVIGVYIAFLLLLILAPALLTPRVVTLVRSLAGLVAQLAQELGRLSLQPIQVMPGVQVEFARLYEQLSGAIQALLSPAATGALSLVFTIASSLLWLGFVLVVSFWLVKDYPLLIRYVTDRIPSEYRGELVRLGRELVMVWDGFVRGQLSVGIVVGLFLAVVLSLIGMPNGVALGLFAGLMELVPTIGPTVAGVLATLAAFFLGSTYLPLNNTWFALLVALIFILTFQLDSVFLIPRFVGRRVRLHPLVVFIGLIAGAQVAGVLGILLASPTIASLRVIVSYVIAKLLDREPFEPLPSPPDLAAQWRELLRERGIEVLLFDLDGTLVETDDVVVRTWARRVAPLKRMIPALEPERAVRWIVGRLEGPASLALLVLDRLAWDEQALDWAEWLTRQLARRPPEALVAVPGAVETIRHLRTRYRLGIVTTRRLADVKQFLRQEGLEECFEVIVARDTYPLLKPHPGPVLHAAQMLGVKAERCALVGDTMMDIAAAQAAGAVSIGVLSGFGQRDDLAQADLVVDSVFDLLDWMFMDGAQVSARPHSPEGANGLLS